LQITSFLPQVRLQLKAAAATTHSPDAPLLFLLLNVWWHLTKKRLDNSHQPAAALT
jgi:hypothetical protein